MFIIDILVVLLATLLVLTVIVATVAAYLTLPFADALNRMLRRIGLAGPSETSRTIGVRGVGVVDESFQAIPGGERADGKIFVKGELWNAHCKPSVAAHLQPGDEVEFVYNEDLSVSVLRKREEGAG